MASSVQMPTKNTFTQMAHTRLDSIPCSGAPEMIARNYIQFPEALRFQRELFHNGYRNSPRIMRLMECVFSWTASIPEWVTEAKARAVQIVKAWKSRQVELFEMIKTKAKRIDPRQLDLVLFPAQEPKEYWSDTPPPAPETAQRNLQVNHHQKGKP